MIATVWSLGWVIFSITATILIMCTLESRKRKKRQKELEQRASGYRLTPQAADYRLHWSKQILALIDARCKEIAKKEKVDVIDGAIIRQAIMEVMHDEWVRLSERR